MKVWMVERHWDLDVSILGIFSTKEKAIKAAEDEAKAERLFDDCPSIHSCGFTYLTTYENDAAAEKLINWYAAHRPHFKGRITHTEEKSTLVISRKK